MCPNSLLTDLTIFAQQKIQLLLFRPRRLCKLNSGLNWKYCGLNVSAVRAYLFLAHRTWLANERTAAQLCQKLQTLAPFSPPLFSNFCPPPPPSYNTVPQQFPSSHPVNQHKIALTVADHRVGRGRVG